MIYKLPIKPGKGDRIAIKALNFFKTLYTIERRIREEPPDERYRIRQRDTVPVLDKFKLWLDKTRPRVLSTGKLGEALAYAHHHRHGLTRFCDDGRLAIDNNAVEKAIRPFCVGRRCRSLVIMSGSTRSFTRLAGLTQYLAGSVILRCCA